MVGVNLKQDKYFEQLITVDSRQNRRLIYLNLINKTAIKKKKTILKD